METRFSTFMEGIHGNLSKEIKGVDRDEKWSDLWYIFKPEGFEKTLAEIIQTKKQLIKLSHNEMKNRKIDNTMTSKYISNINIILINIVITLGISGVGKTSLIQR